jgi:high-affinity Fe2+/Pb2+ permease
MTTPKTTPRILLRSAIAGVAAAIVVCLLVACTLIGIAAYRQQITLHPNTLWERDGLAIREAASLLRGAIAGAACGLAEAFLVYRRLHKKQRALAGEAA